MHWITRARFAWLHAHCILKSSPSHLAGLAFGGVNQLDASESQFYGTKQLVKDFRQGISRHGGLEQARPAREELNAAAAEEARLRAHQVKESITGPGGLGRAGAEASAQLAEQHYQQHLAMMQRTNTKFIRVAPNGHATATATNQSPARPAAAAAAQQQQHGNSQFMQQRQQQLLQQRQQLSPGRAPPGGASTFVFG